MDTTAACILATLPLLVRRADPGGERHVAALLGEVLVDPAEVADLMQDRGVLVLCDLSLPPTAPPLAAAAFRLDRPAGTAQLVGIGFGRTRAGGLGRPASHRRADLAPGRRLQQVHAVAAGGGAAASLLASAGFTAAAGQDADGRDGRSRLELRL